VNPQWRVHQALDANPRRRFASARARLYALFKHAWLCPKMGSGPGNPAAATGSPGPRRRRPRAGRAGSIRKTPPELGAPRPRGRLIFNYMGPGRAAHGPT